MSHPLYTHLTPWEQDRLRALLADLDFGDSWRRWGIPQSVAEAAARGERVLTVTAERLRVVLYGGGE